VLILWNVSLAFTKPFLGARNPLLVAVSLVPIVAALTQVWADRLALAPLAKQYARMSQVFDNALAALDAALARADDARGRDIVKELGVEALAENADWLILHRERPVQVPGAK
jgi:hypothetical protein